MTISTAERARRIAAWRAQDPPLSWRKIGEKLGISAQAAWRIGCAEPVPPLTSPKVYRCHRCFGLFKSMVKAAAGPARCRLCGRYDWRAQ